MERKNTDVIGMVVFASIVIFLGACIFSFIKDDFIGTGVSIEENVPDEEKVSSDTMESASEEISVTYSIADNFTEEIAKPNIKERNHEVMNKDKVVINENEDKKVEENQDSREEVDETIIEQMSKMTLEEKICQMFIITPEALTGVDVASIAGDKTKEAFKKYPVGGIILFASNITNPEQIKNMTTEFQNISNDRLGLPILIGIDEEGGRVSRIASNSAFDVKKVDSMLSIAQTDKPEEAYNAGKVIGKYLKDYGFNIDFAPDADVITEKENYVIGDRSFGTDPRVVSEYANQYLKGLNDAGILGCPKHYPGHGGTKEDSHDGTAVNVRKWDELYDAELVPFRDFIDNNVQLLMASHIVVPNVTEEEIPTTLSKLMLTEKLRGELCYKGVIISDAMNMGAIINNYTVEQSTLKAVEAGIDIILMPGDFKRALNALINAVETGTITEERIDESVYRILKMKISIKESVISNQ